MTTRRPIPWRAARRGALAAIALAAACSSSPDEPSPAAGPVDTTNPATDDSAGTTSTAPTTSASTVVAVTTTVAASSTEPATSVPAEPAPSPVDAAACVADLTVRERAALVTWPAVVSSSWDAAAATVDQHGVGGVLLLEPEGWSADDLARELRALEAVSSHGLIVATDEEGGAVQRLDVLGELPSQQRMSLDATPEEARAVIAEHGRTVRKVGVDMVLGPVVDVAPDDGEVPLSPSRFFAGGPESVAEFGAAYVNGWNDAGLFAVFKHYPGHGAASGDTHDEAGVTPSLAELARRDLLPYAESRDLAATAETSVMIGHLTVPGLTDGRPATRSRAAVGHLRDELGYGDALLITDALGMAAVGLPEPEASVLALEAGIDVAIFTRTGQTGAVIDAIEAAVTGGRIPSDQLTESAARVMKLLARDGHTCNEPNLS